MWKILARAEEGVKNQLQRQETVAQNLANLNTTGYKRKFTQAVTFQNCLQTKLGQESPDCVSDLSQGELVATGSPLNLAIKGAGFFQIQSPTGIIATRNGNFALNKDGLLVSPEGYPVLGSDGPVQLNGKEIEIMEDGSIKQDGQITGKLALIADSAALPENSRIVSGSLEASNVNPLSEMVKMIESYRQLQMNEKVIKAADELMEKINTQLGKTR